MGREGQSRMLTFIKIHYCNKESNTCPWWVISKQPGCWINGSPSIWTGKALEACILMTFPWANLLACESPTCRPQQEVMRNLCADFYIIGDDRSLQGKFSIMIKNPKYYSKLHQFHFQLVKQNSRNIISSNKISWNLTTNTKEVL